MAPELTTARLRLRHWRSDDLEPFAALNADPEVMAYFPGTLTRGESDALAGRIRAGLQTRPFGLWAVEVVDGPAFIGFVGLSVPSWAKTPMVEVGWRLARPHWGYGYASEAGRCSLAYGLETLELDEIVSFTAVENVRSQAVMERIGMAHDPSRDFDHPLLPGHRLERHVFYAITSPTRRAARAPARS